MFDVSGEYELSDGSCRPCDAGCVTCKGRATECTACSRGR